MRVRGRREGRRVQGSEVENNVFDAIVTCGQKESLHNWSEREKEKRCVYCLVMGQYCSFEEMDSSDPRASKQS